MNKWIVPSLLSLSLFFSCAKPKYRSEEGGFAVSFKGIPQENTENVATAHGDIAVTIFLDEEVRYDLEKAKEVSRKIKSV
ncbi:MAG: hypothetical protein ACK40M_11710, partial [Flavobacteriales bacterium]